MPNRFPEPPTRGYPSICTPLNVLRASGLEELRIRELLEQLASTSGYSCWKKRSSYAFDQSAKILAPNINNNISSRDRYALLRVWCSLLFLRMSVRHIRIHKVNVGIDTILWRNQPVANSFTLAPVANSFTLVLVANSFTLVPVINSFPLVLVSNPFTLTLAANFFTLALAANQTQSITWRRFAHGPVIGSATDVHQFTPHPTQPPLFVSYDLL